MVIHQIRHLLHVIMVVSVEVLSVEMDHKTSDGNNVMMEMQIMMMRVITHVKIIKRDV